MALTKATYSLIEGAPLNVLDFGAVGNDSTDSTAAIQAAFTEGAATGRAVYIPAGVYKITASLLIPDDMIIYGDGKVRSTLKLYTANTATFALVCNIPNNFSIIGLDIGHIGIVCNGGAAKGSGVYWGTTATNSAFSTSAMHDMVVRDCTIGFSLNGVVYMSEFARITVTGTDDAGWRTRGLAGQVIYNTYQNLEVTNVASNAYAYDFESQASYYKNLSSDGCAYFDGAYSSIDGYVVEGITAATPKSTYAIECNQIMSVRNIDIINVPTAKCQYGLSVFSPNFGVSGIRVPDSGAGNQPDRLLLLFGGQTGTIADIHCDRAVVNKLETYLSDAILNNFVLTGCSTVTDRGLSYAQGTWTPTYPTNWSTAPTTISAQYTKIGRQVTATVYAQDGVTTADAIIGGLPFTSNSAQAVAAYGATNDTTKTLFGNVLLSSTQIQSIPARTLTGTFWQMTVTYFT